MSGLTPEQRSGVQAELDRLYSDESFTSPRIQALLQVYGVDSTLQSNLDPRRVVREVVATQAPEADIAESIRTDSPVPEVKTLTQDYVTKMQAGSSSQTLQELDALAQGLRQDHDIQACLQAANLECPYIDCTGDDAIVGSTLKSVSCNLVLPCTDPVSLDGTSAKKKICVIPGNFDITAKRVRVGGGLHADDVPPGECCPYTATTPEGWVRGLRRQASWSAGGPQ